MYVCAQQACSASRSQKSALDALQLELTGGCEPPCVCWQGNPGRLLEEHVLLILILLIAQELL